MTLQRGVKFIRGKNDNEFHLWALLKLQYSLLTATDYYATNHYKSKLKKFYDLNDFGIINNSLRKKMKENFIEIEYNKSLFYNTSYYLKYPLKIYRNHHLKSLYAASKLGAEVYSNIIKYKMNEFLY